MEREWPTSLLMFVLYRATEDRIFDAVEDAGFSGLTRAQGRLLAGLDPDGTRLLVLADRARIAKQTAVSLVDRLEAAGIVERTPDPSDGRARLIKLTERGQRAIPVARTEEQRIDADWAQVLGERRMLELRRSLEDLWAAMEPAGVRSGHV
ncbi:MarR family winged helix-turn-helix transcriptional regulator [Cumulibacter manganitolerans]|uniref:MarR family winged helix-turn-helix transcriptional regulator n=1 Tax=Cumulibacter manganitolerans TaxID=1884992 RepID=UPI002B21628E|nr:MarR family transcriptional regulator [Cumulibacter manganitolerans]